MDARIGIEQLAEAVEILGGQGPTAAAIGVRQSAISECLRNGKRVAAEWCIPLERATEERGRKISRGAFRPDIYPEESLSTSHHLSGRRGGDARRKGHADQQGRNPTAKQAVAS